MTKMSEHGLFVTRYFPNYPLTILLIFIVALLSIPIYRITLHPLAKYPGPTSWSISRIPWHVSLHRGRLHLDLQRLHRQYGNIVRIAPNELSFTHTDAYRDIYTFRPGHKVILKNNVWFNNPRRGIGHVPNIVSAEGPDHARLQRAFGTSFSDTGVKEMSPVVSKYVGLMVQQMRNLIENAEAAGDRPAVINLVDWLNFTTFDIGGELSFGDGFGSVAAGKAHPWVDINQHFGRGVALMTSLNFLKPVDGIFLSVMPQAVREKFKYHRELTAEKVGQRLSNGTQSVDFLSGIEMYNKDCEAKGHQDRMISREEINSNIAALIFASSETSASALSSVFRNLLQDKKVWQRLTADIDQNFENEHNIIPASVSKLTYVDAVLQEGMRLAPPASVTVPRTVPDGGEEVCGERLPSQTFISVASYASCRSPEHFHNPDSFVPERFLPDSTWNDNFQIYQPFGQGRHLCLGYRLAWVVMRMILVRLVYAFEMDLVEPMKDFGQQKTFLFWQKEPLMVRLRKRERLGTTCKEIEKH